MSFCTRSRSFRSSGAGLWISPTSVTSVTSVIQGNPPFCEKLVFGKPGRKPFLLYHSQKWSFPTSPQPCSGLLAHLRLQPCEHICHKCASAALVEAVPGHASHRRVAGAAEVYGSLLKPSAAPQVLEHGDHLSDQQLLASSNPIRFNSQKFKDKLNLDHLSTLNLAMCHSTPLTHSCGRNGRFARVAHMWLMDAKMTGIKTPTCSITAGSWSRLAATSFPLAIAL